MRTQFVCDRAGKAADEGLCVFGVAPGGRLHEVNCITCAARLETSPTVPEGII